MFHFTYLRALLFRTKIPPVGKNHFLSQKTVLKKGLIHYTGIRRDTEKITIIDNVGIAMGQETIKPNEGRHAGKTVKRRYTNVWMQEGHMWTLIARQATDISIE